MDAVVDPNIDVRRIMSRDRPSRQEAEAAVRTLIAWTGDNPDREGLADTPRRVVNAYDELFRGYREDTSSLLAKVFDEVEGYDDLILVRDIPFYSHCEHHMVPIIGHAHIAYYPNEGVVGLSKLARVVDVFARRLQTQETMTQQILDALEADLAPRGAAVMIEAEHLCMSMRGVGKQGSTTVTSRFSGIFEQENVERDRFTTLARRTR